MEVQLPTTDKKFVESIIPQKKPFVMVDTLILYTENLLKSEFSASKEDVFVEGGVFQASGVLEHQAQSVALHTGYQFFIKNKEAPVGYIGAIKKFEVLQLPKVGERIETEVKILEKLMDVTLVKIVSSISGKEIARSEMKTVLK